MIFKETKNQATALFEVTQPSLNLADQYVIYKIIYPFHLKSSLYFLTDFFISVQWACLISLI